MLISIFLYTGTQSVCLQFAGQCLLLLSLNVRPDPLVSEYTLVPYTCHHEVTVQRGVHAGSFLGAT